MNRRLLYEDSEGDLHIIVPYEKFQQPNETEKEALARLAFGFLPRIVEFIVCLPEDIPSDLTWRRAWRKGDLNEPVKIDFERALRIHRERLLVAANGKIARLNEELEIALERDDLPTQVSIRRTKNILRTMHEMNLTHCKTPEDLKFAVPKELHEFWDFYPLTKEQSNDHVSSKNGTRMQDFGPYPGGVF